MTLKVPSWRDIAMFMQGKDEKLELCASNWQPVGDTYTVPDHGLGTFDYDSLYKLALKSRDPSNNGKFINSWLRLKIDNEEPHLIIYGKKFMSVGKDNIATVHVDTNDVWHSPSVFVSAVSNWIPFMIERHRTGIYRIMHKIEILREGKVFKGSNSYPWNVESHILKHGQVICKGLRYDLKMGKLLNPNTDHEPKRCVEDTDKRKEWRKNITAFKKQLRTRLRIGAVDTMIDKLLNADTTRCLNTLETYSKLLGTYGNGEYGTTKYYVDRLRTDVKEGRETVPFRTHMDWQNAIPFIAKHVENNTMTNEIFIPLCLTLHYIKENAWKTEMSLDKAVDVLFNKLSLPLRRHFGVITEEATVPPSENLSYAFMPRNRYQSIVLSIEQVHNIYKGELK